MHTLLKIAVGSATVAFAKSKVEIDGMRHDIAEINAKNFNVVIDKHRNTNVAAIWFYKQTDKDAEFLDIWNEVATKSKYMVKIAAMDCEKNAKECVRYNVKETPHVQMFPILPMSPYHYTGEMTTQKILNKSLGMIPSSLVTVHTEVPKYKEWIKKNPTKPKFVLFSDKSNKPSVMWKALSQDTVFHRTVDFAFVSKKEGEAITKEAGAKKYPSVVCYQKGGAKKEWYDEKEIDYMKLHHFINIHSESGMGDTVKGGAAAADVEMEAEEIERVREMTKKNAKSLCFGGKSVCGIYLSKGPMSEKDIDMVEGFENKFKPKNERAIKYNWMWLDVDVETEFLKTITEDESRMAEKEGRDEGEIKYPTMIFVKPHQKKREEKLLTYLRMANGVEVTESSVSDMVDKVAGGAQYMRSDIPALVDRKKKEAKKAKEEL